MSDTPSKLAHVLKREFSIFIALLFFGFILLPIGIWFVGKAVFGAYGGAGYGEFFGSLSGKIRSGDTVAWFLVLSPWIVLQILRLAALGWRVAGKL